MYNYEVIKYLAADVSARVASRERRDGIGNETLVQARACLWVICPGHGVFDADW